MSKLHYNEYDSDNEYVSDNDNDNDNSFSTFKFENELKEMKKLIDQSITSLLQTGPDLSESGNYTESQELLETLKGFIRLDNKIKMDRAINEEFGRKLRNNDLEAAETFIETTLDTLSSSQSSVPVKWTSVPEVKEYIESIWEIGPGYGNRQGYPVIENDPGIQDDDIVMQSRDSLMCPISQCLLKEPLKNPVCGHTFSKAMIEGLFSHRASIECPVSGCRNVLNRDRLIKDIKLERKLEKLSDRIFK